MDRERANNEDARLGDALRLARNLCAGIGAFFVTPAGEVRLSLSATTGSGDLADRSAALARNCLRHPEAQGDRPYYTAEPMEEQRSPDDALACVAMPVVRGSARLGVLGVVDNWLPELDEEQLAGLRWVAERVAEARAQALAADEAASSEEEAPPEELMPEVFPPEAAPEAPAPAAEPPAFTRPEAAATPTPPPGETPAAASAPEAAPEGGMPAVPLPGEEGPEMVAPQVDDSEAFVSAVVQHLPDGVLVVREDGTILFANTMIAGLIGLSVEEILGTDVSSWILDESSGEPGGGWASGFAEESGPVTSLLGTTPPWRRVLLRKASGEMQPVDITGSSMSSSSVGRCRVALIRQAGAEGAARLPASFETLLETLEEGVVVCDFSGQVIAANDQVLDLVGAESRSAMVGHSYTASLSFGGFDGAPITWDEHPLTRALAGVVVETERCTLDRGPGDRRQVMISARPMPLSGGTGAVLLVRDVTEDLEEEARLTHLALHDPLTGLANRRVLQDHVERALRNTRTRGETAALIYLDLDDFKSINDRYGHPVGDDVLVLIARRIQHTVRATEVVARLGGDEFVVALTAVVDGGTLDLMVERLRKALAAPFNVSGLTLSLGASLGWVLADRSRDNPDTLLARADAEMYRSKQARRRSREDRP